jgi:hypothetical protein
MGDQAANAPGAIGTNGNGTATWVAEGGADNDGGGDDDGDDTDDSGPADPRDNNAQ